MSSQSIYTSFRALCSFILRYKHNFLSFNGCVLGSFKSNNKYDHDELLTYLSSFSNWTQLSNKEALFANNLHIALFLIFTNLSKEFIHDEIFELLSIICNSNPRIGHTQDSSSLSQLSEIYHSIRNPEHTANQQTTSTSQSQNLSCNTEVLSQLISAVAQLSQAMSAFSSVQVQTTASHNSTSLDSNNKVTLQCKNIQRRILRKKNDIKLLEFHLNNETTPSALFFDKFPVPFLWHDEEAVNDHNQIVKEAQQKMLESSIKHLNRQLASLQSNLEQLKPSVVNFVSDSARFFNDLKQSLEKELSDEFRKADEKAKRFTSRPFTVSSSGVDHTTGRNSHQPRHTLPSRLRSRSRSYSRSLSRHRNSSFYPDRNANFNAHYRPHIQPHHYGNKFKINSYQHHRYNQPNFNVKSSYSYHNNNNFKNSFISKHYKDIDYNFKRKYRFSNSNYMPFYNSNSNSNLYNNNFSNNFSNFSNNFHSSNSNKSVNFPPNLISNQKT